MVREADGFALEDATGRCYIKHTEAGHVADQVCRTCVGVVLLRGSGAGGSGWIGEKGGGGEVCCGDRVCGVASEGGEGEARFSGEGPSPLFQLDFAGISRRAL